MIVIDSSVWIDYFNGIAARETELLDDLLEGELVLIGDLILAEVLQGFDQDADFRTAQTLFDQLDCAEMSGCDLALTSARNYRLLRRRGVTVRKTIDVMIATFCVEHGHELLHADRDFDLMRAPLGLVTL
jgi:predicted nucleic acid-binding protein